MKYFYYFGFSYRVRKNTVACNSPIVDRANGLNFNAFISAKLKGKLIKIISVSKKYLQLKFAYVKVQVINKKTYPNLYEV